MSIPAAVVTLPTTPVPPVAVGFMGLGYWVPDPRDPGAVRHPGRGDEGVDYGTGSSRPRSRGAMSF